MLGKHKLDVRYLLIFDTTEMIVFVWAVFFNYDKGIGFEICERAVISILSACHHAINVEEGYDYFNLMKDQFGIQPSIEHYNCMGQLLLRGVMV